MSHPLPDCLLGIMKIIITRLENNMAQRPFLPDIFCQFNSCDSRHTNIRYNDIELELIQKAQCLCPGICLINIQLILRCFFQHTGKAVRNHFFIIHH